MNLCLVLCCATRVPSEKMRIEGGRSKGRCQGEEIFCSCINWLSGKDSFLYIPKLVWAVEVEGRFCLARFAADRLWEMRAR